MEIRTMAYTDAQGRPELIAGDFVKKSTGSATIRREHGEQGNTLARDTRSQTGREKQRKPDASR
jgi:hypothetical protein